MQRNESSTSFGNIFKSTALFGFVQVFRSIIGIIKNKIVAVLLGAEGVGLIGIYDSIILFVQTLSGFGIGQSAVKDIAEANAREDQNLFSRIIEITNKIVIVTAIVGAIITILFSGLISQVTLGDGDYKKAFVFLGIVVALNIANEGKLAILKGMRRLRMLAYANIIGVIVALFVSVPMYYYLGEKGILPVFVISSGIGLLVSQYFVKKIPYDRIKVPIVDVLKEASPMMKMGGALMFVTFLDTIVSLIVLSYIRSNGGLADVGFFNAGKIIINSYFGVLITALSTDYYPRISEINSDNKKIEGELNKQSLMSIVLCAPLFVFFLFLLPLFIEILYTKEFLPTVDFVKYSIYGTLVTICSNQVDMILVAKQRVKVFAIISVAYRFIQLVLSIYFYQLWGLKGLGITMIIIGLFHMIAMSTAVYSLYKIRYQRKFIFVACAVLILAILSSIISEIDINSYRYILGGAVMLLSIIFSVVLFEKLFDIRITSLIKKMF